MAVFIWKLAYAPKYLGFTRFENLRQHGGSSVEWLSVAVDQPTGDVVISGMSNRNGFVSINRFNVLEPNEVEERNSETSAVRLNHVSALTSNGRISGIAFVDTNKLCILRYAHSELGMYKWECEHLDKSWTCIKNIELETAADRQSRHQQQHKTFMRSIAVSSGANQELYVGATSKMTGDCVRVLSLPDFSLKRIISLDNCHRHARYIDSMTVDEARNHLLVSVHRSRYCCEHSCIYKVDLNSGTVLDRFESKVNEPAGIHFDQKQDCLFVCDYTDTDNRVNVLSPNGDLMFSLTSNQIFPQAVCVIPSSEIVLVVDNRGVHQFSL